MKSSAPTGAPAPPGALARTLVIIFFIGLLATPYFVRRFSSDNKPSAAQPDRQAALARYGFYLQEVSHAAGIDYVHQAPTLDPKLAAIMPEVSSMGAAVSIVDLSLIHI